MTRWGSDEGLGFGPPWLPPYELIILTATFYSLADIVLLALLITSCLIRRPWHDPKAIPFKSLFFSLLCHIISISLLVFSRLANLSYTLWRGATRASTIVYSLSFYLRILLVVNVLHRLLKAYTARDHNRTRRLFLLSKVHRSTMAILSTTSVTFFVMRLLEFPYIVPSSHNFQLAVEALFLLASLEIMFEVFVIIWKAKNHTPSSKKEAILFTIGAVCFFFSNLSLLVTDILNTLSERRPVWYSVEDAPDFFPITIIVTSTSIIGMYTGIIYCCMQWHKLGPHGPSKPVSTEDESSQMLIVASDQR